MIAIRSKATSVKNHVIRHRGKYIAGSITIVYVSLMIYRAGQWNEFLIEKGIDPMEFYLTPADFAEFTAEAL